MVSELTDRGYRNDFAQWIRGGEAEPDEHSTMNCWEALLFSAFRAGVVEKSWLIEIHDRAAAEARQVSDSFGRRGLDVAVTKDTYGIEMEIPYVAYRGSLMRSLYSGDLTRYSSGGSWPASAPAAPVGHVVFFDGLDHVALSLGILDLRGRQQVLSLLDAPVNSSKDEEADESAVYGWLQVTSIEELLEYGDFTVVEFARPRWDAPPESGARTVRMLPVPLLQPHESDVEIKYEAEDFLTANFRRPSNDSAVSGGGDWGRINRSIPGVTLWPAISQNTWTTHDDEAAAAHADRERFIQERYPILRDLNPTGNMLNCTQAIIAVDHMLNGATSVRLPPATGSGAFYGLFLLKNRYQGRWVDVANYDEIIEAVRDIPGSRGVVYLEDVRENWAHVINVVDTPTGVVFLDGQAETLAELLPDLTHIGLVLYHPRDDRLASGQDPPAGRASDGRPHTPVQSSPKAETAAGANEAFDVESLGDVGGDSVVPQAAVTSVDAGMITPKPIWYLGSRSLYRADTREPAIIFTQGFWPRDPDNLNLHDYVQFGADDRAAFGFVSTSESMEWALDWHATGYVYQLDPAQGGVDVIETMNVHGIPLRYTGQTEVAFPGGISTEFIQGAWEIVAATGPRGDNSLGRWIPNPNYRSADQTSDTTETEVWSRPVTPPQDTTFHQRPGSTAAENPPLPGRSLFARERGSGSVGAGSSQNQAMVSPPTPQHDVQALRSSTRRPHRPMSGRASGGTSFPTEMQAARTSLARDPALRTAPLTLDKLHSRFGHLAFEQIATLRQWTYELHDRVPPTLSREQLETFLKLVWNNRGNVHQEMDVYDLYLAPTEPNPLSHMPDFYAHSIISLALSRPPEGWAIVDDITGKSHINKLHRQLDEDWDLPDEGRLLQQSLEPLMAKSFTSFGRTDARYSVAERIYINARADHSLWLMAALVRQVVDSPAVFPGIHSAKIAGYDEVGARPDNIILYANDEAASARVLRWLAEYRRVHPEAFMWSVPAMTGQVMEGVSTADNPHDKTHSFGSLRSKLIFDELRRARLGGGGSAGFFQAVLEAFEKSGIDPWIPHKNLTAQDAPLVHAGGLRGGLRVDDPLSLRWPVGHDIAVGNTPRGSKEDQQRHGLAGLADRRPEPTLHEEYLTLEAPASNDPTKTETEPAEAQTGTAEQAVYTFKRAFPADENTSSAASFTYTLTRDGQITLPDGLKVPGHGWLRHGPDFFHTTHGVVLYGESGWIGRVQNWDTLAEDLKAKNLPRYRAHTHADYFYLTPRAGGGRSVRIGPITDAIIWTSPSRSTFDENGEELPKARQACVNVAAVHR